MQLPDGDDEPHLMKIIREWKDLNEIPDENWFQVQDQLSELALQVRELSALMIACRKEAVNTRRSTVRNGDDYNKANNYLQALEWSRIGSQTETIRAQIFCPQRNCGTYLCPGYEVDPAQVPVIDENLPAPAISAGTMVAFVYDGRHCSVDSLAHDAQNCEFLIDADTGIWHRCRPVMPMANKAHLDAAIFKMYTAVEDVNKSVHAFAAHTSHPSELQHFAEVEAEPDHNLHDSVRQKSIHRAGSFARDRHGHRIPSRNGMHAEHFEQLHSN